MSYLTETDVHNFVNGICFKTGPPGRVGVEAEWLVSDQQQPHLPVPLHQVRACVEEAGPLPNGSAVTFEPGGQLELSSPPLSGPAAACSALATDLAHVEKHLTEAGLRLEGTGLDPHRRPNRQLVLPRYVAMERYFDGGGGPTGRAMMCSTASLQICLDIGADHDDLQRRWQLVHRLGPVLLAAFANSPRWRGKPTGWRSTRWAIWAAIDSTRTRPATEADPVASWTGYALSARTMAVPRDDGPWDVDPGLAFGEWLAGDRTPPPTPQDLEFHLSTLFPPVRPRGWLELRMVDALPEPWWPVPVAVAAALVDDPAAARAATQATERLYGGAGPQRQVWLTAARDALTDRGIAACARVCFAAACEALTGMGAASLLPVVQEYRERYVDRGRCPADDQLATEGNR